MGGTADATVSWHPVGASAKNAPSSYSVTTQGASCTTATGAASSCTLTSLPAGRTYDFAVTATNSAGTSPTTSLSSTLDPEGQSISFPTLSNVTFGQAPLTLTAVATSGLPVTYGAQGACEVTGDVLTITGAGDCSVTASQDGSTAFQAATPAANYFSIAPAPATITVTGDTVAADGRGHAVTASVNPAGPGLMYSYCAGKTAQTCQSTPPSTPGVYTVTVSLDDANYVAPPVTTTLVITPGPFVLPVTLGGGLSSSLPSRGVVQFSAGGVRVSSSTSGLVPGSRADVGVVATEALGSFVVPTSTAAWSGLLRSSSPLTSVVAVAPVMATSLQDLATSTSVPYPSGEYPGTGRYHVITIVTAGLVPNSTALVVMHSDNVVLAEAKVNSSGVAELAAPLYDGWAGEQHALFVAGTYLVAHVTADASGQVLADVTLPPSLLARLVPHQDAAIVTVSGGAPVSLATVRLPGVDDFEKFLTLSTPSHLHHYSPTSTPNLTMNHLTGTIAALSTVAAGVALARTAGSTAGAHGSLGAQAKSSGHQASVKSVEVTHHTVGAQRRGVGDRLGTWRLPGYEKVDDATISIPLTVAPVSALGGALTSDGSYLRAPLGPLSLLLPAAGLVLGAVAAQQTHGYPLPPHYGVFVAVFVLGIFDALAGFAAIAWVVLSGISTGHIFSIPMVNSALTLGALWCGVPFMIKKLRPFLRDHPDEFHSWWVRAGDVIIGTALASYLAAKLVKSLPLVSNLILPIAVHASAIGVIAMVAVSSRYVLSAGIALAYPERLQKVTVEELPDEHLKFEFLSLGIRSIFIVLIVSSIVGRLWLGLVVAAIMGTASFVKAHAAPREVPAWMYRAIPRRLGKVFVVSVVGTVAVLVIQAWITSAFWRVGALLIFEALLGLGIDALSGLHGDPLGKNWATRLLGATLAVLTALALTGRLIAA